MGLLSDGMPSCLDTSSIVLSALLWKKNCGSLKLYADSLFASFIDRSGLTDLWDDGIDTMTLDSIPASVNQRVFWSAAKLFALKDADCPVAMVDNDLFFWKDVGPRLNASAVTVLHREELWDCYVPKRLLGISPGYCFDPAWSWRVKPCNTAFAYFPDDRFKDRYTAEAIRFMTDNPGKDAAHSSQMVFAEQRILAMCARRDGIPVKTLVSNPFDEKNDMFTHLWGAKKRARGNKKDMKLLVSAIWKKIKEMDDGYYGRMVRLYPNGGEE